MDIKNLMQQMHEAQSEEEKNRIGEEIKSRFSLLSDSEKKEVQKNFMQGLDAKLKEADALIAKIDIALEIEEISKYVSLSKIASNYFGKSKEWLYQRIKGYAINGKSAAFTEDERKKLASALEDISQLAHKTSLKIA
jgi:predicted transcriptional regulator